MHAVPVSILVFLMASPQATLHIDGKPVGTAVPLRLGDEGVWVGLDAFAAAVGRQAKVVSPGKLVVLCNDVSCVAVHLTPGDRRTIDGSAFVRLRCCADALGYAVSRSGTTIDLVKPPAGGPPPKELPPGSMLPDIVLTDLNGRDVHLADYVGRRVLICTWASW